jgi:hypothetical protein
MEIIITKLLGDNGADYSMVSHCKCQNIKMFVAKRNSNNRFNLHVCNGTNDNLIEENMTFSECKEQIKILKG